MATSYTGLRVQDTYNAIIKIGDNSNLSGTAKLLSDGLGNDSPLYLSGTRLGIGISPAYQFHTSGNAKIGGNLIVSGNLTVNGTLTYLNVEDLAVEDPLIKLAKDNTANTLDIGFFGKYVATGTKYKGLFNDASDDKFKLFIGTGTEPTTTVDTTASGYTVGTLVANLEGNVTGTVSSLSNHTTSDLAEGTNLYYTNARFDTRFTSKDTDNLSEGSTNLYYTNARADARVNLQTGANLDLSSKDTDDLSEGTTNLYYTDARFDTRFTSKDTDNLSEGTTNLYFTTTRARASFTQGTGVTITAGEIAIGQAVSTTSNVSFGTISGTTGTFSGQVTIPETPTADAHAASKKYVDDATSDVDVAKRIEVTVKNVSGGSLAKGVVVHAAPTATPPSGNVIEVVAADANVVASMPAIGVLNETIADQAEGEAVMFGAVSGIDTSSFSIGDELYVSETAGAFTATKPTAFTSQVQKIAVVIKSHASNGLIKVFGAGRSNDVPNRVDRDINFTDSSKLKFGTDSDLEIYHDGTDGYIDNINGELIIQNNSNDKKIIFKSDNGIGDITEYFRIDGNINRNVITVTTQLNDNVPLIFGGGAGRPSIKYDSTASQLFISGESKFLNDLYVVGSAYFDSNVRLAKTDATSFTDINADAGGMYIETSGSTDALSDMRLQARASGAGNYVQMFIKPSNQSFLVKTNGTDALLINSTQDIGIGTTNPGSKLQVEGAVFANGEGNGFMLDSGTAATARTGFMKYSGTEGQIISGNSTKIRLTHRTDSNYVYGGTPTIREDLVIDTSGNSVFSGTITSSTITTPQINLDNSGGGIINNQTGNIFIQTPSGSGWIFRDGPTGYAEKMRLGSDGNLSVGDGGTGARNARLLLNNVGSQGTPQLMLVDSDDSGKQSEIRFDSGNLIFDYWSGTSRSEYLRIKSDGDVGINVTNPLFKLDIFDAVSPVVLQIKSTSTSGAGFYIDNDRTGSKKFGFLVGNVADGMFNIKDEDAGVNRFVIDTNGNIGITTETPSTKLNVSGGSGNPADDVAYNGYLVAKFENANQSYVEIRNSANQYGAGLVLKTTGLSDYKHFLVGINNDSKLRIGYGTGITNSKDGSSGLTILQNGSVGFGLTAPVSQIEALASQSNSGIKTGGLEMQSYAVNNSWYAENIYYGSGGWTRRSAGGGTQIYLGNGTFQFVRFPYGGTANSAATPTTTMFLNSNGNIGVGTSTPTGASGTTIAINGQAGQARLAIKNTATGDGSDDGFQIGIGTGGEAFIEQRENNNMVFTTNNLERIRIDSSGYVNIKQKQNSGLAYDILINLGTSPDGKIAYQTQDQLAANLAVNANSNWVKTGNNIYNTNSANVGIGTTTIPSDHILQISNDSQSYARFALTNSQTGNASGDGLIFQMENLNTIIKNQENGYLVFGTNGRESDLQIDSSGRVGIGVTPSYSGVKLHTYNNSTDAYNIFESSTNKWVFGEAGGVCQVGGRYGHHSGIQINTVGRVGIRTSLPQSLLQVGSIAVATNVGPTDWNQVARFTSTDRKTSIVLQASGTGSSSSNQGLPAIEFDPYAVDNGGRIKTAIVAIDNYYGYRKTDLAFVLDSADDLNPWGIDDTKMIIKNNGNIGVNTTNPTNGKLEIQQTATTAALWVQTGGTTNSYSIADFRTGTNLSALRINGDGNSLFGGNIGINTTSPSVKLQVNATGGAISSGNAINNSTMKGIKLTNTLNDNSSVGLWFGTNNVHWSGITGQRNDYTSTWGTDLRFYTHNNATSNLTSSYERMIISSEGSVGIGNSAPGYTLDVTGTIRATSDVIAFSDKRVKENIFTINNALNKVTKLRGVKYTRKDIEDKSTKIGVIAQEVLDVLPEVVETDNEGMYSVAYGNMAGVFIEAIKELKAEVDSLKQEIKELKK